METTDFYNDKRLCSYHRKEQEEGGKFKGVMLLFWPSGRFRSYQQYSQKGVADGVQLYMSMGGLLTSNFYRDGKLVKGEKTDAAKSFGEVGDRIAGCVRRACEIAGKSECVNEILLASGLSGEKSGGVGRTEEAGPSSDRSVQSTSGDERGSAVVVS